ncbi:MAG: HAD family phosphatase [Chitinophagaceae bacterium]|nr:HAD family phosphatase [Chitinophagaceae bacterium]
MTETKNIIFDLGGVLLDIDYQKSIDAFTQLGLENFDDMFSQFKADELFEKLETGKISENEFYHIIRSRTKRVITNQEIDQAWNALILHFRTECLVYLEKLAPQYSLYLLSNTNRIHLKCFKDLFTRETGKPLLDRYFTKTWYSNEIGLRKPGEEVFNFVLEDENLKAAETLFIDDTISNIETAQKMGFKTHLLLPSEKIEMLDLKI